MVSKEVLFILFTLFYAHAAVLRHRYIYTLKNGLGSLGNIDCSTNGIRFSVSNAAALRLAFTSDLSSQMTSGSYVHKVQAGNQNIAVNTTLCTTTQVDGSYHSLFIFFGECRVQWYTVGTIFFYEVFVHITIRTVVEEGIYDDIIFLQPLQCSADSQLVESLVATQPPPEVYPLPMISNTFDIPIDVRYGTTTKRFPGFATPKQVRTIEADLMPGDRDIYNIYIDQCYVQPTSDPNDERRFYLVSSRGCRGPEQSLISTYQQGPPHKLEFLVPRFELADGTQAQTLYYQCQINACRKNGNPELCTQSCPSTTSPKRLPWLTKQDDSCGGQSCIFAKLYGGMRTVVDISATAGMVLHSNGTSEFDDLTSQAQPTSASPSASFPPSRMTTAGPTDVSPSPSDGAKGPLCYVCDNCAEVSDTQLMHCPSVDSSCFTKTEIHGEHVIVSRGCSESRRADGCHESEKASAENKITTCHCNSDKCNPAAPFSPSACVLVIGLAVILCR